MKNILKKINTLLLILCFVFLSCIYTNAQKIDKNLKALDTSYNLTEKGVLFSKNNGEWVLLDSIDIKSFRTIDNYFYRMFAFDKYGILYHGRRVSNDTIGFKSYESLQNQNCFLWKTNKSVYWGGVKLENVDASTLEYLGYQYYKDKNAVFHGQLKLEGADPSSFLVVNNLYGIDSLNLYREALKMIVDGQSPQLINESLYKTDKAVYRTGKYFTNPKDNPPLENIDPGSLRQLAPPIINRKDHTIKFCPYVMDQNYIFYGTESFFQSPKDTNEVKVYKLIDNFVLFVPPNNYYHEGYTKLDEPLISGDSIVGFSFYFPFLKKGVFMVGRRKIIPFKYDLPISRSDVKSGNGKFIHKNQLYDTEDNKVYELDSKTLKVVSKERSSKIINNELVKYIGDGYYKSNKSVYYFYSKLEGISPKKMKVISNYIFKNNQGVFFFKKNARYNKDNTKNEDILTKIKYADAKTFKNFDGSSTIGHSLSIDKHNFYSEDEIIPFVKSKNIKLVTPMLGISDSKLYILISNIDGYWLISPKPINSDKPPKSEYLGKDFPYELLKLDPNKKEVL